MLVQHPCTAHLSYLYSQVCSCPLSTLYHQRVLSTLLTPLQSSGQGSKSSSAGTADFTGATTFSATFSLVATFDVESDTGVAGVWDEAPAFEDVKAEQPEDVSPGQHEGEMTIFSVGP